MLSVKVSKPVRLPVVLGVKFTDTVQIPFGWIEDPVQFWLEIANSPVVDTIDVKLRAAVPVFVTVMLRAALVVFTF